MLEFKTSASPQYFVITPNPGATAKLHMLMLDGFTNLKFVVFQGYGPGTGSDAEIEVAKTLTERGIFSFRASGLRDGNKNGTADREYETGDAFEKAGAKGLGSMSGQAVITFI